jgi:AraC-like DNA-binding protein
MRDLVFEAGGVDTGHEFGDVYDLYPRESWVFDQHRTDFKYRFDGDWKEERAGTMILISPDATYHHGQTHDAKSAYVDDWMYVSSPDLTDFIKELRMPVNEPFDILNDKFIAPYITRIQEERRASRLASDKIISCLLVEMLVEMGRLYEKQQSMQFSKKSELEKIRNEMLLNYSYNWTLNSLSVKAGYTPAYFCSLYSRYYGISPIDDLLKYRMMIAREELTLKNLSITEIAKKCGFSSIHHFSYYFKKCYGISPTKFNK